MKKKETERRVHTKEFKAEAAALAQKREKPISQIAADLGLNESVLRRWTQEAREARETGRTAFPGRGTQSLPACAKRTRRSGRRRTKVRLKS